VKRVILEVRVKSGKKSLDATDVQLPGFTIDNGYAPVPIEVTEESVMRSLEAANEEVVLVRGEVDEQQEEQLRAAPNVIALWNDAPISPFIEEDTIETFPMMGPSDVDHFLIERSEDGIGAVMLPQQDTNGTIPAFDLGTASPCGTTDCASTTPKGTIADVAKYLGCTRLWNKGVRGQGVVVGVCDSGVNKDRVPSVIGGWSPTSDYTPGTAPVTSHGTMCAFDVMGMAPDAKILDIAILRSEGSISGLLSDAIAAFQWALNQYNTNGTPQILNNSWGIFQEAWAPDYATNPNHPFTRKVVQVIRAGMIVTFAAGNCGSQCPSSRCGTDTGPGRSIWGANGHEQVITVGAANIQEQWIGYTSQGPAALHDKKPDFCAPSHFKGNTNSDNGTSAAAPICAGVIALFKSHDANLTQAKAKEALSKTAKNICTPGWDAHSGSGMIQAYKAYRHLYEPPIKLKNMRLVDLEITQEGNQRRYSGVFHEGRGKHALWVRASWQSFVSKWREFHSQGLHLVDLEITQEGSQRRYSGVFREGRGKQALWVRASWQSFVSKWRELHSQGLRLVDLEITQEGSQRRYSGVFHKGRGKQALWVRASWQSFVSKWREFHSQGLRLVNLEITQEGNQRRYSGVFHEGRGKQALWVRASWQSFVSKWRELHSQGLHLVDLEITQEGNQRRYSGVFHEGRGKQALWVRASWQSFVSKWREWSTELTGAMEDFEVESLDSSEEPDLISFVGDNTEVGQDGDGVGLVSLEGDDMEVGQDGDGVGLVSLEGDDMEVGQDGDGVGLVSLEGDDMEVGQDGDGVGLVSLEGDDMEVGQDGDSVGLVSLT
jgi:subtilisin family serine protease